MLVSSWDDPIKRTFLLCLVSAILLFVSCAQMDPGTTSSATAKIPQSATPAPTPTQIPGRPDLYQLHDVPEHLAYIRWSWIRWQNSEGGRFDELEELVFEFTIHNDVEPQGGGFGYYLMLGHTRISGVPFYFGVQTDVKYPDVALSYGKGSDLSPAGRPAISPTPATRRTAGRSRLITRETSSVCGVPTTGVRATTACGWRPMTSAPQDPDGAWFGVWITDLSSGEITWIGSLKFPLQDGKAVIETPVYTTMEFYAEIPGSQIRPIDIPYWHVSMKRPVGDGVIAHGGRTGYSAIEGKIMNADIRYVITDDIVYIQAGEATERRTEPGIVDFW